jgi:signal transduction histidine kinase
LVETRKANKDIEITVNDNGAGISPDIINKVFQPFFTTKLTGQGTGWAYRLPMILSPRSIAGPYRWKAGKGSKFIIRAC